MHGPARVCAAERTAEWKRQVNTDRDVNTQFGDLWEGGMEEERRDI